MTLTDQLHSFEITFGIGLGVCVLTISAVIGIFSQIYSSKKTLKYIHDNIFDEHMAINILMNIGLISILLGIFYYTYALSVEGDIVKANATIAVSNIMEAVSPLMNNDIKTNLKNKLVLPDLTNADATSALKNTTLMKDAFSKLTIILDICLTVAFIICIFYKHSFIKILGLNLILVALVGCTEYTFLNFIPHKYIAIDTNFVRWKILTNIYAQLHILFRWYKTYYKIARTNSNR